MNQNMITKGLAALEQGVVDSPVTNLAYRVLVAEVSKLQTTWQSIQLSNVLKSPNFVPLTDAAPSDRFITQGLKTPTHLFYFPILNCLLQNDGTAHIKALYTQIEQNHIFTTDDLMPTQSAKQEPRWKVTLRWAKEELIQKGFIKRGTSRGVWELTPQGAEWLSRNTPKGM